MTTVRTLSAPGFEGRRTGTAGGLKAREWVLGRFKTIGVTPAARKPPDDYVLPFRFRPPAGGDSVDGANVAGVCAAAGKGSKVFVVSAHYDHLGIRDGAMYPGADDNASGVAVLLALAERCRRTPFRHTTVFVAFDAEEQGLQGARAFVTSPPVPREQIALNVNLDMVARGDKGELYAAGTHHYPDLKAPLAEVATRASIKLLLGHDQPGSGPDDWTLQSDHAVFHGRGVPFVYFGVEDHPDYHRPTDTADRIDAKVFADAAETILDAIASLDRVIPLK
jgi:Zn-dependent M28 family amino/carboxypeptidase